MCVYIYIYIYIYVYTYINVKHYIYIYIYIYEQANALVRSAEGSDSGEALKASLLYYNIRCYDIL